MDALTSTGHMVNATQVNGEEVEIYVKIGGRHESVAIRWKL